MSKPGKRFRAASEAVDNHKLYGVEEAVKLLKGGAKAKFDETVEISMNLGVDPRHAVVREGQFETGEKAHEGDHDSTSSQECSTVINDFPQ